MPSATLQSRISAFESLAAGSKSPQNIPVNSPTQSPNSVHTTNSSFIDLKDWVLDDGAMADSEPAIGPQSTNANGSASRSPSVHSTRTPTQSIFNSWTKASTPGSPPLISFGSPPKPKPKPKPPALTSISPKSPSAPPLPPRKPSYSSLKSVPSSSSLKSTSSNPPKSAFLYPPNRADSLAVDPAHTYPPLNSTADPRPKSHAPASSISSFHSVSLSSDTDVSTPGSVSNFIATFPMDHASKNPSDPDSSSLTDSYENVSTSSLASPTTEHIISMDWEKALAKHGSAPPQLPKRPTSSATAPPSRPSIKCPPPRPPHSSTTPSSPLLRQSPSLTSLPTSYVPRRVPPPPPSRSSASDRSSIQSTTTTYSSYTSSSNNSLSRVSSFASPNPTLFKTKRPTPVPPAARKRYEAVFNATVIQRRKAQLQLEKEKKADSPASLSPPGRRAAGWRGLSVDLITGSGDFPPIKSADDTEEDEVDKTVGPNERLEGKVVRLVWRRSRLEKAKLKDIWSECDPTNTGSLGVDAFVKGMWRIDEELRRVQLHALKSASTGNLGSFRSSNSRTAWTPVQKSRDILR